MWDWIGDHWFQLLALLILGIGFMLLISMVDDLHKVLAAILAQIKGLRADVAQSQSQPEHPEQNEY
jgi:hypothetical protein